MFRHLILLGLPALALAQGTGPRMSIPALGYVFDENAKAIRLIAGVPGAASFDLPVPTDVTLDSALVYSRGRGAVANTKEGRIALVDWSANPRVTLIESALGSVTLASFSRRGDRVAISDGAVIEVWSDLRGTPVKTAGFSGGENYLSLALSEAGTVAAATRGGSLLLLGAETRTLASGSPVGGLAFHSGDLLATDAAARTLLRFRDSGGALASSVVAFLEQAPGAVATSSDGRWAALASLDDILIVNLADGSVRPARCSCRVTRFDALEGNLVFHAIDARTGAGLLFDADGFEPRTAAIPAMGGAAQ